MEKKQEMLQTGRLILKGFDERDREAMVDLFFREEIKRTYMLPDFESREQAGKLFERMMVLSRSEDRFVYGIYWGQTLVGFVNDCEIKEDSIEIGYVIVPEYQGRGFATEAVQTCIKELFRMGFRHVIAGFFQENPASCRVMQKCGMRKLEQEEDMEYRGVLHHCLYYGVDRPAVWRE